MTQRAATTVLGVLFVAVAIAREPAPRVVEFGWMRRVGGRPAVISSDRRPYWPHVSREELAAWIEAERADARWWSPRNSEQAYWVLTSDGRVVALTLEEWSRLDVGAEVPR